MSDGAIPALLVVLITILRKWLQETLTATTTSSASAAQLRTSTYEIPTTYLPSL